MENYNTQKDELEILLDKLSNLELDKRRISKYNLLLEKANKKNKVRQIYKLAGLAIGACLLGFGLISILPIQRATSKELFVEYYQAYDFPTEYRAEDNKTNDYLLAIESYRTGDALAANQTLNKLCTNFPNNPDYQFLYGLTWMDLGKYEAASQALQVAISKGGSYKTIGLWYQALNRLAAKDYDGCAKYLKQLRPLKKNNLNAKSRKLLKKVIRINKRNP